MVLRVLVLHDDLLRWFRGSGAGGGNNYEVLVKQLPRGSTPIAL